MATTLLTRVETESRATDPPSASAGLQPRPCSPALLCLLVLPPSCPRHVPQPSLSLTPIPHTLSLCAAQYMASPGI